MRRHAVPVLCMLLVDLVWTHRLVTGFTSLVPRDDIDGAVFAWGFWDMAQHLSAGHDPFSTKDTFFPVGARLAFHAYAPLVGLFVWPLIALFGLGVALNTEILTTGLLIGIGGYALVLHLTRDRVAATFAGCAMVVLPLRIERMSIHYNLSQLEFVPFGILAALLLYERRSWKAAVALGAMAGLGAGADFTIFALVTTCAMVIAIVNWRQTLTRAMAVRLLVAVVTCCVVSAPLLFAAIADIRSGELDPMTGWGGADQNGADPLSYLLPLGYHPWAPGAILRWRSSVPHLEALFPTFTVLVLAAFAVARARFPAKRQLVAVAATCFVLSLGPFLVIWGHTGAAFSHMGVRFDVPLPYLGIVHIPVVNGLRAPARFGYVTTMLLVVLAGIAVANLRARSAARASERAAVDASLHPLSGTQLPAVTPRRPSVRGRSAIVAVLALCVLFESWHDDRVPFTRPATENAAYRAIAKDPGERAVLEVPLQWGNGYHVLGDSQRRDGQLVFNATIHGKPVVNGYSGRYPEKRFQQLASIPAYHQILQLQGDVPASTPITFTAHDLAQIGIGYVVTHRDLPAPAATAYIEQLGLPLLASDGTVTVYRVP